MRLSPLDGLSRTFTNGIAMAHLAAGRSEEALDWAERTLREEPGYRGALLSKAVTYAQLDRIAEAREALRQVRETQPGLTISRFKTRWLRLFSPETARVLAEGLRKAGLPEE
jgi:adenylate cyclase